MASRLNLQSKLEELLELKHVYYDPPESLKMEYDAIVYSKNNIKSAFANNKSYINSTCYSVTVISRKPDNPVIRKLLELPLCSYDRHYIADNLHHDTLTIYY